MGLAIHDGSEYADRAEDSQPCRQVHNATFVMESKPDSNHSSSLRQSDKTRRVFGAREGLDR